MTEEVTNEALADEETGVILCYHPPIFSGIKKFNLETALQRSLLSTSSPSAQLLLILTGSRVGCIASGVSVYCIHTAADNALQGVNDFVSDGILISAQLNQGRAKAITLAINPPIGQHGSGSGRIVDLSPGVPIPELIQRIKERLGLAHLQLAQSSSGEKLIKTVAICAGSGEFDYPCFIQF